MNKPTIKEEPNKTNEKTKGTKKVNKKQLIETTKTILITVLVTAIVAFITGIQYQKSISNEVSTQVKEMSALTKPQDTTKK